MLFDSPDGRLMATIAYALSGMMLFGLAGLCSMLSQGHPLIVMVDEVGAILRCLSMIALTA
jgi:hypothetical protein